MKYITNRGIWKYFPQTSNLAESKISARELLKSDASLRSIFNNMDTAYILIDTDLKIISFNQSAYDGVVKVKGIELAIGAYIIDYTKGERRKNIKSNYSAVLKGQKRSYETSFIHTDGTLSWYYVKLFPVFIEQEITGMIVAMEDISSRKISEDRIAQSELRFRALVENSHDAIMLIDKNFVTQYRSPSLTRMFGWRDEQKLQRHLSESLHPDDMKNVIIPLLNELLSHPGRSFPVTFRKIDISGNYIWMEGVATNMFNNKNVNAIVVNFRDITERKSAEELIQRSEELYRQIVETAQEGIWMIDKDDRTN